MSKPNNITHKEAKEFLDFYLKQGYCVSEMNGVENWKHMQHLVKYFLFSLKT